MQWDWKDMNMEGWHKHHSLAGIPLRKGRKWLLQPFSSIVDSVRTILSAWKWVLPSRPFGSFPHNRRSDDKKGTGKGKQGGGKLAPESFCFLPRKVLCQFKFFFLSVLLHHFFVDGSCGFGCRHPRIKDTHLASTQFLHRRRGWRRAGSSRSSTSTMFTIFNPERLSLWVGYVKTKS